MPQSTSNNDDLDLPPSYPGSDTVRIWLVAGTLFFALLLLCWLAIALSTRDGLAGADLALMSWLHSVGDPRDPIGSPGFEGIMRDISALGSNTLLVLATLIGTTLLALLQRLGAATFLFFSATGGLLANALVKSLFARGRPDFISVTVTTDSTSFPSSHAMLSAIVLLTIAAIAARERTNSAAIALLMGSALTLVLLIGVSRVYLGVHWPSDVLTGWVLGCAWVLGALKLAEAPQPPE